MAKRKSKSKKQTTLILTAIACLFGLAAILMMFAPAVVQPDTDSSFTGVQTAFGYSKTLGISGVLEGKVQVLNVNALALIAYMLPIAGIVLVVLFRKSSLFNFIAAGAFIAAGVCAFLMVQTFPATVIGSEYVDTAGLWQLGIGAILSGAFSCVAGLASIAKVLLK